MSGNSHDFTPPDYDAQDEACKAAQEANAALGAAIAAQQVYITALETAQAAQLDYISLLEEAQVAQATYIATLLELEEDEPGAAANSPGTGSRKEKFQ
ncbi:MAG: hypothetical protein OXG44_01490 [Gammaproteobacteria bacterium]|nr:hypothetical protein [Gammaproteobacteria bacterium]